MVGSGNVGLNQVCRDRTDGRFWRRFHDLMDMIKLD